MICRPCRDAAAGKPGASHCTDPGGPSARCCCQHRPVRPAEQPVSAGEFVDKIIEHLEAQP